MNGGRATWSGFYYDGRTAERQPVTVTLAGGGLRVERADGTASTWPIGGLRQTQGGFASEQLRIEFGTDPPEVVFVNEPGLAQAIRHAFPHAKRSWRDHHTMARMVGWSVAALAAATALYLWGAPAASTWIAARVPPAWEASLGQNVAERLAPTTRQCGDSTSLAHLRAVLDRLLAAGAKSPYEFRLAVIRDPSVNAFAAPGGFVAVHSGLIAAAETPEQFAGVLAHEIQHVTRRHSTRAMIREAPLRLALATLSGGSGIESVASVVGSLGALGYRRGDEVEADREGMRLLQAAQVDASGMVAFMRALEGGRGSAPRIASYVSSHPRTADRVAELEAIAKQSRSEAKPLLDSAAWQRVRNMCR